MEISKFELPVQLHEINWVHHFFLCSFSCIPQDYIENLLGVKFDQTTDDLDTYEILFVKIDQTCLQLELRDYPQKQLDIFCNVELSPIEREEAFNLIRSIIQIEPNHINNFNLMIPK